MAFKLKEKQGVFELWTTLEGENGSGSCIVLSATGRDGDPNRVTVPLFSLVGAEAVTKATKVLRDLAGVLYRG